jgi:hypothetical protein
MRMKETVETRTATEHSIGANETRSAFNVLPPKFLT